MAAMAAEKEEDLEGYVTLLYYQYTSILSLENVCADQLALCESLDLKGRIRISPEGINGTLDGPNESVSAYVAAMDQDATLSPTPIHWKYGQTSLEKRFKHASVKVCKEVGEMDEREGFVNITNPRFVSYSRW